MIALGVIFIIVGLVLVLAPIPFPNVDAVGWFLALVGLVLVIVGVLLGADVNLGHASVSYLATRSWG